MATLSTRRQITGSEPLPIAAKCVLNMTNGFQPIEGLIQFEQHTERLVIVAGIIKGLQLSPGNNRIRNGAAIHHGLHVHELGDLTDGCASTGGHYNPLNSPHGPRTLPGTDNIMSHDVSDIQWNAHIDMLAQSRHVGDLGNVEPDSAGEVAFDFLDPLIKLTGEHSIIGRALVLHAGIDDEGKTNHPKSKQTGNAGSRIACCIIGRAKLLNS